MQLTNLEEFKMQRRILLVDDEPSLRRSISLGLNQRGIDVDLSENGMTALRKIDLYKQNDVNLDTVVLDIQLPDIDGIKLGKIIKSKYPDTSMIFITGYADKLEETEIEDLKVDSFLQKPFDADDLTAEIDRILQKHTKQEEKIQVKEEVKTVSAYALIKVDPKADFFKVYKKLYYMENVLYCDATRGDIDIIMLIQSDSIEKCSAIFENEIKTIEGITEAEFLNVDIPVLSDSIKDIINSAGISLSDEIPSLGTVRDSKHSVCSYVLVEVEREKLEDIYPVLKLTENVVYCDFIAGKYNLIIMVSGTQFSQIDKFIENKLINMNGILKAKEYPIINIYEI
jgi:CheY-like chemotaxis protein